MKSHSACESAAVVVIIQVSICWRIYSAIGCTTVDLLPSRINGTRSLVPPLIAPPPPPFPHLIDPLFIGPPTHWPPILYCNSLVPHLIGSPSHWSPNSSVPLSLVPQVAPMHHPFQWSPISLVPRLTGPPSHWSPIPLVPFSLVPKFISPPLHCLNALVILITGHPFH